MRRLFDGLVNRAGNMPPLPGIYPDYSAPIIRNGAKGRELVMARWGFPAQLSRAKPRLMLLQDADDLFVSEPALPHAPIPLAGDRLTSERGRFRRQSHCN